MRVWLPGRPVRRRGAPTGRRKRFSSPRPAEPPRLRPRTPLHGAQAAATGAPAQPTWSRTLRPAWCAARHKLPDAMPGATPLTTQAEMQPERPWPGQDLSRQARAAVPSWEWSGWRSDRFCPEGGRTEQ